MPTDPNAVTAEIKLERVKLNAALLCHAYADIASLLPGLSEDVAKDLAIAAVELGLGEIEFLMEED